MKPLPNNYDHKNTEQKWHEFWEQNQVYAYDESASRADTFVIDTPPPTVSGLLHMGHIFSYTQADFVARYMRMRGKTVFYPMGFDDNGLPTERLVEKVKKIRAADLSREDFIKVCEEVVVEAENEFRRLFKSVALSVDWKQEYQTISDESRKISQLSFLDIFNKKKAYRQLQPMFWDPVDLTALAQAEIEDKEFDSHMNDIMFTTDSGEEVIIATTRPELIPACVAVFHHPEDKRYQHLTGKNAVTALFGVEVPILADENVNMEKGTGLVMCCTFGDETDIKWWRTHNLPTRIILNQYGKLDHMDKLGADTNWPSVNKAFAHKVVEQIKGKKAKDARVVILDLLKEHGLLLKQVSIKHAVKCAERSGAPLEILPTYQWFIKILDQKQELLAKTNECNWHPEFMRIRMEQWINGLNWDWCISRQRYFGVPFPVWYVRKHGSHHLHESDRNETIIVADKSQLPVNPLNALPLGFKKIEVIDANNIKAEATEDYKDAAGKVIFNKGDIVTITPEADVMDTWATSSVSPQLSSKAINKDYAIDYTRHQKLFPADLRPQAHEIIRTWAFYTIVKAHLHEDTIPWKNLMISGWCLASDKTKMSKSKGNVVTPVDLIEEKGADVVRFWASTSRLGADTAYSEDVLKIGKKLINKLWNATKFAAIHLDKLKSVPESAIGDIANKIIIEPLDIWVLSKLQIAIVKATREFERFEYCNAREAVEGFFWNDFCDNYLEMIKVRAYGELPGISKEAQMSAVHTIYHCLDGILRLFAPIVPHITEELYGHIFEEKTKQFGGSVNARGTWPDAASYPSHEKYVALGGDSVAILNALRKIKADNNVSLKTPVEQIIIVPANKDIVDLNDALADLKNVTNAVAAKIATTVPTSASGFTSLKTDGGKYTIYAKLG